MPTVLKEITPGSYNPKASGNNLLFNLMEAEKIKVITTGSGLNSEQEMQTMAQQLADEGRKAYIIPVGGSDVIGSTGYVACAQEILWQCWSNKISFDYIVCPTGSAGTQAGLLAGLWGMNSDLPVIGMNVLQNKSLQEELVYDLAQKLAVHVGVKSRLPKEVVICNDEYLGTGYSLPTPEMVEAVKLVARTEGILLDPVYTGKAMAGLIDLTRKGFFKRGQNVLFLHTGGSPALFNSSMLFE